MLNPLELFLNPFGRSCEKVEVYAKEDPVFFQKSVEKGLYGIFFTNLVASLDNPFSFIIIISGRWQRIPR